MPSSVTSHEIEPRRTDTWNFTECDSKASRANCQVAAGGLCPRVMNTDNMTISGETIDCNLVLSWTLTIPQLSSAPLISTAATLTAGSHLLPSGTLPALLKPFCLFWLRTKKEARSWAENAVSEFSGSLSAGLAPWDAEKARPVR